MRVRREPAAFVTLVGGARDRQEPPGRRAARLVEAEPVLTTWRQGRSLPYGEGVALWALGEMVKAQAGIWRPIRARWPPPSWTGPWSASCKTTPKWPGSPGTCDLVGLAGASESGGDRQAEAFVAWRRFLEALAEQGPTVLVFEDLHWADETLLDFLDHLAEWAIDVPLLVICTARPELLARRPGWGGGKPNAATVSLAPLSEADTARMVAALLGQALLPAETQAALLARAGGNPLYAEEYVRMLADRGFLTKAGESGGWSTPRNCRCETVQGIIAARLDARARGQGAAARRGGNWQGRLGGRPGRPRRRPAISA